MDGTPAAIGTNTRLQDSFEIQVSGMTCGGCAGRVEKALQGLEMVDLAEVNLATEKAHVKVRAGADWDPAQLLSTVEQAGFHGTFLENTPIPADPAPAEGFGAPGLLVIAVLCTAPFLAQMLAMPTTFAFELPVLVQLVLATIVQFGPGSRFYRPAWRALLAGGSNMDTLVALGTTATWGLSTFMIWSQWPAIDGSGLYFEASASVITLVLVGKFMETKARQATTSAIKGLSELQPDTALIRKGDQDLEIGLGDLSVGDLLVIKPGARVAADARIVEGLSHVDESLLTGESLPVAKAEGDRLIGGAINGEGLMLAETTAVGHDSTLAQIIKRVESAQMNKPPVQKLVDKIAGYFVPFIIVVAVLTLGGWLFYGADAETALIHAATVLVIACPCALGLATPTAVMVGTGAAARSGILIRDMAALERARQIDCVVFDKTGTLTEGRPKVVAVAGHGIAEDMLMARVAAAQRGSEHPLAKAIAGYAADHHLALPTASGFRAFAGRGISARVDGTDMLVGSRRLMTDETIDTAPLNAAAEALERDGHTVIWVADGARRRVQGLIAIGDRLRDTASLAIKTLKNRNIEVVLLSGDNPFAARKVAAEVGIDRVVAQALPDEKAQRIEHLKAQGRTVAMVGDGVNDAPALAVADLGIAMGGSTDIAMETAGITLMRADPMLAVDAMQISNATYGKIKQNLFWAFLYNVVAIPLAVFGVLTPVVAGAAMALSSVSVVSNSLLLRGWRAKGATS